ncbi:uncharacterized protein LAESUDRAFT_762405 [Laetiporus sulphureus 93-53]|uniref:Uncharacterized protein n=1 Tax=Laetiporus sulphureus 93-53 TaxID=1314785 RepID=A0A165CKS4_9APHY|nr:uncharacterized protein LAESUDRAFT_762405 [Laetiporus sulphureus 93-53]KZT02987.1 hypothetical protein LAESUDRAFT_762405 [Laetiporus sulphureus 93-53]
MPDVYVINETHDTLNIAFRFVAPADWENAVRAGKSWKTHLPSTPFKLEVRVDTIDNRFSAEDSVNTALDISAGWLAGAAGVVGGATAAFGLVGLSPVLASTVGGFVARPLVKHAMKSTSQKRFQQNAEGMLICVGVLIPMHDIKTYAIRFDENAGQYIVWDVVENRRLK